MKGRLRTLCDRLGSRSTPTQKQEEKGNQQAVAPVIAKVQSLLFGDVIARGSPYRARDHQGRPIARLVRDLGAGFNNQNNR